MGPKYELKKLCESWWGKLANSSQSAQHPYADHYLRLLGWESAPPLGPGVAATVPSSRSFRLQGEGHDAIAAHFVQPGTLEPPSNVLDRGLDFCDATRLLVTVTHALHARYAFITDLYRSYLYDARTEELLLYADCPADFDREFDEVLARSSVERGALEDIRRSPRSTVARRLREWRRRWEEQLVSQAHVPADAAALAIDRLIVLRCLLDQDVLKRSGLDIRRRFEEANALAASTPPQGCGRRLTSLFHDLWLDWKGEIFAAEPTLDAALEREELTAPLLREFALLARTKFTIPVILESFNHGEAAEKARVRMIPEEDEDRIAYLSKQTSATIDSARLKIDVADEGYRSIFHWFDRLVDLYERLATEFECEADMPEPGEEMDLFAWSERAAARPKALSDKFQHVAEQALAVMCATERQHQTARLMLYLHVINRYASGDLRFTRFPRIENALIPRPKMTDADRRRMFNPLNDDQWDVV